MATGMDDTIKNQLFWDKQQAEQPIPITNLRVASTGMVFMHNSRVIKDIPTSLFLSSMYHLQLSQSQV